MARELSTENILRTVAGELRADCKLQEEQAKSEKANGNRDLHWYFMGKSNASRIAAIKIEGYLEQLRKG